MSYTFCTLFDRNYLYKGLALYYSLRRHCPGFDLWVLCMDETTFSILGQLALENAHLLRLSDFETEALKKVKKERTVAEYCWTCSGPLIDYVMQRSPNDAVAYLDADLFFYSDPKPIYDELDDNSILIIEHRFSPNYAGMEKNSGIFNVSMVIFRDDAHGKECLGSWINQCLEACFLNPEAGQCGDQKYLDDWPTLYKKVTVLRHKGGGLAPWNLENYAIRLQDGHVCIDADPLIFYHFHSLHLLQIRFTRPTFPLPVTVSAFLGKQLFLASTGYRFTKQQIDLIYRPYVTELRRIINMVDQLSPAFACSRKDLYWWQIRYAVATRNLLLA